MGEPPEFSHAKDRWGDHRGAPRAGRLQQGVQRRWSRCSPCSTRAISTVTSLIRIGGRAHLLRVYGASAAAVIGSCSGPSRSAFSSSGPSSIRSTTRNRNQLTQRSLTSTIRSPRTARRTPLPHRLPHCIPAYTSLVSANWARWARPISWTRPKMAGTSRAVRPHQGWTVWTTWKRTYSQALRSRRPRHRETRRAGRGYWGATRKPGPLLAAYGAGRSMHPRLGDQQLRAASSRLC